MSSKALKLNISHIRTGEHPFSRENVQVSIHPGHPDCVKGYAHRLPFGFAAEHLPSSEGMSSRDKHRTAAGFPVLKEEVNASLRPAHPAVAVRKSAFSSDARFQKIQGGVKAHQIIGSCSHRDFSFRGRIKTSDMFFPSHFRAFISPTRYVLFFRQGAFNGRRHHHYGTYFPTVLNNSQCVLLNIRD